MMMMRRLLSSSVSHPPSAIILLARILLWNARTEVVCPHRPLKPPPNSSKQQVELIIQTIRSALVAKVALKLLSAGTRALVLRYTVAVMQMPKIGWSEIRIPVVTR